MGEDTEEICKGRGHYLVQLLGHAAPGAPCLGQCLDRNWFQARMVKRQENQNDVEDASNTEAVQSCKEAARLMSLKQDVPLSEQETESLKRPGFA